MRNKVAPPSIAVLKCIRDGLTYAATKANVTDLWETPLQVIEKGLKGYLKCDNLPTEFAIVKYVIINKLYFLFAMIFFFGRCKLQIISTITAVMNQFYQRVREV